jgi:rSAM/selenodomain-associated transferase 2
MATPFLSVIIPVLNEAAGIVAQLEELQTLRRRGAEIVLDDGGSTDNTCELARPLVDRFIVSPRGRAAQMNAGARSSSGDTLLFLHADTRLPASADDCIRAALDGGAVWGRFDVRIDSAHPLLRLVARMMNWRSRLTGVATGDQAIFVRRSTFEQIGGYPELPLMEDIALSKRLKRIAAPACLRDCVLTSGRRWETHGVMRTIVLMWRLRAAYFFGAVPEDLAARYGYLPEGGSAANPPSPPYQGGATSPPLTRGGREGLGGRSRLNGRSTDPGDQA